ncbi:TonB-dependent receptor [Salinibacter sp. 10B]|uniref:TonB-dependent receptor n=1 Tax=Salinibacter sp. 10B TaxID=1923971 RepID=UPI000CF4566E|nr:TonB-dependent receptor [Salinibacter sp. 10B]
MCTPSLRFRPPVWSWLLVGLLLFGPAPAQAQVPDSTETDRYTLALRNVPLNEALQALVTRTSVDLAYSTTLVEGKTVYCRARSATAEGLLSCILDGTGVEFLRTASGSYLLVASPEASPSTGRIAGRVVDAATGEPLPNANVLLADAGTGTATNSAGQFTVAPVLAGMHRLVVTYVGYRSALDSVRVPPNGRDTIRVALRRRVVDTAPIVVDGLQQRLPSASLGRTTLSSDALEQMSGRGTPDVLRSASRRIGVSLNRPLAEVNVQGGSSGEHVMRLDGVPVREPVSLGGLLSAFSPQALERLTVHKAGFGAAHGSYTAGVMDATHDLSRSDAQYGAAQIDPLSIHARADLEWLTSSSSTGQAMGAVRTSVWDAYRAPSLHSLLDTRTTLDRALASSWMGTVGAKDADPTQTRRAHVQFSDVHAAVRQELTPFQQIAVSGYRGRTRLGTDVASLLSTRDGSRLLLSQDRYNWSNTAVQGRYEWLAGSRVTGAIQLRGSWHDSDTFFGFRQDSLLQHASSPALSPPSERVVASHSGEGNQIGEWGGHADVDVSLSPRTHLRVGVTPQFLHGQFRVRNPFLGILEHESSDWQVGSYAEAEVSPGLNLTGTVGTRLTYLRSRASVYAEPRLSLRYDQSSTPLGGLAVRVAGGLYRQYVLQSEISSAGPTSVVPSVQFWLPLDASLAPPRAYHTTGSILLTPTATWSTRLETYYKWQPRTLEVDYAGLVQSPQPTAPPQRSFDTQSDFVAAGRGRAYGVALHLQRDGERVSGRASIEWSGAERRYPDRFDGRYVPAPWEQPVRITTGLDVALAGGLTARAHWHGIWGRSWAFRGAYYDYLTLAGKNKVLSNYALSHPGRQTLSPYSRLDLGLDGNTTMGDVHLTAQVRLVNVFDRRNAFDQSITPSRPAPTARTLPGRRVLVRLGLHY